MRQILPCLLVVIGLAAGCRKPAQLGDEVKCHKAAEALYTAVCSRKMELLEASEKRINELLETGDMPKDAHASLAAIIGRARAGRWQPAAEDLYAFINGQEPRTGPHKH